MKRLISGERHPFSTRVKLATPFEAGKPKAKLSEVLATNTANPAFGLWKVEAMPKTLDDLFNELPPHPEDTPAEIKRREEKTKAEIQREIAQGIRDANGDWIEQPETEDDEDEDDAND